MEENDGNFRAFIGNAMGGLRGFSSVASCVVAGTLAYYLWVKPSQDMKCEQETRAALAAVNSNLNRDVDKWNSVANAQDSGMNNGNDEDQSEK